MIIRPSHVSTYRLSHFPTNPSYLIASVFKYTVMPTRSDVLSYINEIGPYEFENLVAEIWEDKFGYTTSTTSASQDRGVDIVAIQNEPIEEKILIQTKKYQEGNKIGSKIVREYATLYQQDDTADHVVLISTGGFTNPAKKLANDLGITIFNRKDIITWLTDENISPKLIHKIGHTHSNNEDTNSLLLNTDSGTDSTWDTDDISKWTVSEVVKKSIIKRGEITERFRTKLVFIFEDITVELLFNILRTYLRIIDHTFEKNDMDFTESVSFIFKDSTDKWVAEEGIHYVEGMFQISGDRNDIDRIDGVIEDKKYIEKTIEVENNDSIAGSYGRWESDRYSRKLDIDDEFGIIMSIIATGFNKSIKDIEYIRIESKTLSERLQSKDS